MSMIHTEQEKQMKPKLTLKENSQSNTLLYLLVWRITGGIYADDGGILEPTLFPKNVQITCGISVWGCTLLAQRQ